MIGPGRIWVLEESEPVIRVQLVVQLLNGTQRFYPVEGSWKVDSTNRTLVIGKGLGRQILPLDNVESFSPQQY